MDFDRLRETRSLQVMLITIFVFLVITGGVFYGQSDLPPCQDTLALHEPIAEFRFQEHTSNSTLRVSHTGGDTINATHTLQVTIRFQDASTNRTASVSWVPNGPGSFPIANGDTVAIHWEPHAGWIDAGDTVAILRRGYETNRPTWCPNNPPYTTTLATETIGE